MSRRITTRAQVSGYRFGLARAEHALVRRDVRMLHDPMRSQMRALAVGVVIGVLVLAGAGVYGLIRPAPSVGDAKIVAGPGGGLFVLVDDVMHPVLNVTSARLVLGGPAEVKSVGADSLSAYPRGATLGIVGAPSSLPGPAVDGASVWTVCDSPTGTAVVAGTPSGAPAPADAASLVRYGEDVWLLFVDGVTPVRARVDTGRVEVMRALGVEGATVREVSAALLDAFPQRPALAVPDVVDRGALGALGLRIGEVIATTTVGGAVEHRVVLRDGVQPIPATAADMLRAADHDGAATVRQVSPGELAAARDVEELPVGHFPASAPSLMDAPVLCRTWSRSRGDRVAVETMRSAESLPIPAGGVPVRLGSADGAGPRLDSVYVPPGTAEHVAITGALPDSRLAGQRFVVADTGVRYRLAGDDAASSLGLDDDPPVAPWTVIGLLPEGPELSRAAALVARD